MDVIPRAGSCGRCGYLLYSIRITVLVLLSNINFLYSYTGDACTSECFFRALGRVKTYLVQHDSGMSLLLYASASTYVHKERTDSFL